MVDTQHSIPAPIPLRRHSSPVPVARDSVGSSALRIARQQALIVDDCRFIAKRMTQALEARGFECTVVPDGSRGRELLRGQLFDMVVIDVDAPMVDGFSLLRHLRRNPTHTGTPVLMIGAEHSPADHDRAVALGASGYMTKPLQLRRLNSMIDSMVDD